MKFELPEKSCGPKEPLLDIKRIHYKEGERKRERKLKGGLIRWCRPGLLHCYIDAHLDHRSQIDTRQMTDPKNRTTLDQRSPNIHTFNHRTPKRRRDRQSNRHISDPRPQLKFLLVILYFIIKLSISLLHRGLQMGWDAFWWVDHKK